MLRKLIFISLLAVLVLPVFGQTGSPHGIAVSWTAPSPVGGSGTIQGYFLFRCVGTCAVTSTSWISVGAMLPATSTNYLDPASGLNTSTTYSYAVLTVDSNGNQSGFSNISPVSVGASFPTNPGPPTGCQSKVQ